MLCCFENRDDNGFTITMSNSEKEAKKCNLESTNTSTGKLPREVAKPSSKGPSSAKDRDKSQESQKGFFLG